MGVHTFVAEAAAAANDAAPSLVVAALPPGAPEPRPHWPKALAPMHSTLPLSVHKGDNMTSVTGGGHCPALQSSMVGQATTTTKNKERKKALSPTRHHRRQRPGAGHTGGALALGQGELARPQQHVLAIVLLPRRGLGAVQHPLHRLWFM